MVLLTEIEDCVWGLQLNGRDEYIHNEQKPVHLTMAALDIFSPHDEYVQVTALKGNTSFILCTLNAPHCLQQPLDIEISKEEHVSFILKSTGVVHLTGHYMQEEPELDEGEDNALMNYMPEECGDNCEHDHNGFDEEGEEYSEEDDDEDGEEDDEDDEDDDDDEGDMSGDEDDVEEGDEDDEEDEEEDDDEDEEEEEEEPVKPNGKKRKLEIKENQSKKQRQEVPAATNKNQKKAIKTQDDEEPPKLVKANEQKKQQQQQEKKPQTKTVNGVQIQDVKVGTGPDAKNGKYVHVYYEGKLKQNGKQFDACKSGKPFKFRLGSGEVIKGWDIGVAGMKVGGKRILTIPANLAYGNQKLGGIPPNSTLVFEVELKAVS